MNVSYRGLVAVSNIIQCDAMPAHTYMEPHEQWHRRHVSPMEHFGRFRRTRPH